MSKSRQPRTAHPTLSQSAELAALQECAAAWKQAQADWLSAHLEVSAPSPLAETVFDLEDTAQQLIESAQFVQSVVTPPTCKFCGLTPCLCASEDEIERAGIHIGDDIC